MRERCVSSIYHIVNLSNGEKKERRENREAVENLTEN